MDRDRLLGARPRMLLIVLAALLGVTPLLRAQMPAPKCGFLFIVDTSSAMSRLGDASQLTLASLVASGLHGEMRSGEEFTVWTFNDEINARGLPVLSWAPEYSGVLAGRAAQHLKAQKYRRASRMDRLVPEVLAAMRATELLVAVIISDGNEVVVGTPFDRKINVTFGSRAEEMRRTKRPFVTTLAARRGEIVDFAVTLGDEPIALPGFRQPLAKAGAPGSSLAPFTPPTSVPVLVRPGAAPIAATNVLNAPALTNRPSIAAATKEPPPVPVKSAPAAEAVKPVSVAAPPVPQPSKQSEPPKPADPPPPAKAKAEPAATSNATKLAVTGPPSATVPVPAPIVPAPAPSATVSVVSAAPSQPAKAVSEVTAQASRIPVLITNRPPVPSPKSGAASGGDFLSGQLPSPAPTPPAPAAALPSPPVVPHGQTPAPLAGPSPTNPSAVVVSQPTGSRLPQQPVIPPGSMPPAQPFPAPQAAVVNPVLRRGGSWWLAVGSVALVLAGFWVIRPWLRRPEPTSGTSLISRSMDERGRK